MGRENFRIVHGDKLGLERAINDLAGRVTTQTTGPGASPVFAGLKLTGMTGVLQATAGVVSGDADHNSLGNIQGGTTDEYYHLTSAEHTAVGRFLSEETDPVFSAWLLATPPLYSFTESDPIAMGYIDQSVKQAASPTFAGMTLGSLTGLLKGTSGVVSAITDNSAAWNAAQPGSSNLTSLSGLTFASTSFVKMTAVGTFGLDTNTYLTSFTETDPLSLHLTGGTLTGNLLFTDATYDIGATGATRPKSLFLSADATMGGNLLTSGYAGFGSAAGVIDKPVNINYTINTGEVAFLNLVAHNSKNAGGSSTYGLGFLVDWQPVSTQSPSRTMATVIGTYGVCGLDTTYHTGTGNATVNACSGMLGGVYVIKGGSHGGAATITTAAAFRAQNAINATGGAIVNNFAFYDSGQTTGTVNWGLGINTALSYINGSLRIGSVNAPTVALDVTGAILGSTTIESTTGFKCGGTAAVADGTYTVGARLTPVTGTDGTITVKGGIITAIVSAT